MAKRPTKADAGLVARCVSVPVGECVRVKNDATPAPRKRGDRERNTDSAAEFFAPFRAAWRLATDTANWSAGELLRNDVRRTPGMTRLPPMPPLNLYTHWNATADPAFRAAFDGCCGAAADIMRYVHGKWAGQRFKTLWHGEMAPAHWRYPMPWPVRKQDWRLMEVEGEFRVSVVMPGGRRDYTLRPDGYAAEQLRKVLAGEWQGGGMRLCARKQGDRVVGVMMRLSVWTPAATKVGGATAIVRTLADGLLGVEVPGRADLFRVNFAHLPALLSCYGKWRERLSEDTKYEKRWPSHRRRRFLKVGRVRADRQNERVDTVLKQAAACAVGFAARQGCGEVVYDGRERGFLPGGGPQYQLAAAVRWCCERDGLTFREIDASGELPADPPGPLAGA